MALGSGTVARLVQIFAALAVSVGLGWYVWSRVDSVRLAEMLVAVPSGMLTAMIATFLLYQVLRAWRFWIVFPSLAKNFPSLVATICVQGGINTLLPLWLGDVAIVALLRHRHAVQAGSGAAGVLLARGVDLLLHVVMFLVALEIYRNLIPAEVFRYGGLLVIGLALPALAATALIVARRRLVAGARSWLSKQAALAATAIAEMLSHRVLVPFMAASLLMWAVLFLFYHLVLASLAVSGGFGTTFFIYSMLVPAHAFPITGIADFGSHEAVWYFLLRLLGEGTKTAAATAFASHILILLAVVATFALGLIGIAAGRLRAMAPS